jgi:hypothetical protein
LALQTRRDLEEENKERMEREITEIIMARIAEYTETAIPMKSITDLFYAACPNF